MVNGAEIPVNQQVPLRDGDRINMGAWTAITVQYA
jgi:predicted component of type VI protein secretion system